ncbi:hypothetical protein EJ995_10030 [Nonlabens ponticola]|uniref:Uncharacterized protein n=1 Tax=Nonlabens ponticola TaxID=2496866 RepID=A0A3S9N1C6_9FLAO|nr:hypothetical protein EJ995_10030 [Nonlabens ponticola]
MSAQKDATPDLKEQQAFIELDFLSIPRDAGEANLTLSGSHFNLKFDNGLYTGIGIYGAIIGERGGFFTLGANAGYQGDLTENLFYDLGLHIGGGGGDSAPDGGGAFLIPQAKLGYRFENFNLSAGYSYINFFDNGDINEHQVIAGIQFPIEFDHTDYSNANQDYSLKDLKNTSWDKEKSRLGFMVHLNNLKTSGQSQNTRGVLYNGATIRLVGVEVSAPLKNGFFTYARFDGAYDGIKSGYMDVFLGAGHEFAFNRNRTRILAKFAAGAGGGGGVDTQGGFLVYPDLSLEQQLFNNTYLALNLGSVLSPNQHFISTAYGLGLKYDVNYNGLDQRDQNKERRSKFYGLQVILKEDLYLNAGRIDEADQDLYQIALQVNLDLGNHFYLAGQTAFANFGGAGAYAEGLVGAGLHTKPFINDRARLFGQVLAGAAGGGQVSTGQGLIVKPSLGLEVFLSDRFGLRAAGGYVDAVRGDLSSPILNLGLTYNIAILK